MSPTPLRLLALALFATFRLSAQNASYRTHDALDALYGVKALSHRTLNGKLNSFDNFKFGKPLQQLGIGMSGPWAIGRMYSSGAYFSFSLFVPQHLQVNDSIPGLISGFNFGWSLTVYDFLERTQRWNLFVLAGFNTGGIRLSGNGYINQKNPYFAPKLVLNPRVALGRFSLSLIAEYDVDISNKNWKSKWTSRHEKIPLSKTSISGLTLLAGAEYQWFQPKTSKHKKKRRRR